MVDEGEVTAILGTIRCIQLELKVLEARVMALRDTEESPKRFADLEGIWEGMTEFSYEDIQQAKYRIKEFPS